MNDLKEAAMFAQKKNLSFHCMPEEMIDLIDENADLKALMADSVKRTIPGERDTGEVLVAELLRLRKENVGLREALKGSAEARK